MLEESQNTYTKWISVKDRLPDQAVNVLLHYAENTRRPTVFSYNTMAVGCYDYGGFIVEGCCVKVTHWMPLPEPPKEGE